MAILGAALATFGVGIILANQSRLSGDIDRELRDQARRTKPPRQGPPRPDWEDDGPGNGPPPRGDRPPMQRPDWMNEDGFLLGDLRRPRHFDKELNALSQPGDTPIDVKAAQAGLSGQSLYTNGKFQGEPVRIYTEPWRDRDGIRGVSQVAHELRDLDRLWRSQAGTLLIVLPAVLLVAGLGGLFLTSRAVKPIAAMRDAANRITEDNLSERIAIEGDDELAELGQNFNSMVARLETSFGELKEAFENQKRFTADASHELRTPLTRIRLATSAALASTATPAEQKHALQVADQSAESMSKLVQQLLTLAKADSGQLNFHPRKLDLRVLASQAIEMVPIPEGIELETEFPERATYAEVDPDAFIRLVTNLLENAYRHAGGQKVTIGVAPDLFWVQDRGTGISPEHLSHLTERFYRVDAARSEAAGGSGLGLAICKTIVEGHGGHLEISSKIGEGTRVCAVFRNASGS